MTYPNPYDAPTPPAYPQAPAPQYPQPPAYPQAPPAYPQAPAPQYPQAPAYPQAPQQYGYPQPPAPPAPSGPPPSLDAFFAQPATGWGPAWSWKGSPIGTTFEGFVGRELTAGDVEEQMSQAVPGGLPPQVQRYRDGRPKLVMRVPMLCAASAQHPEGKGQWYVRGQARDELNRAMAEAGAPAGAPEKGAFIRVQLTGSRPNTFGGETKQYAVQYRRPEGAAPVPAPAAPAPAAVRPSSPGVQSYSPPVQSAPVVAPAPAAPPAQPPAAGDTDGLSPEQRAKLAQLTGQPAGGA